MTLLTWSLPSVTAVVSYNFTEGTGILGMGVQGNLDDDMDEWNFVDQVGFSLRMVLNSTVPTAAYSLYPGSSGGM